MADEPHITLTFVPLPHPDAAWPIRVRQLLKYAKHKGLRCTSQSGLDDPRAWCGWVREKTDWVQVCTGCTPQVAWRLLQERLEGRAVAVLPRGMIPED